MNDNAIVIEGHIVKEMRCKNDDCRALIGYDNIILGVFIYICPVCKHQSIYKMQYRARAKHIFDKLQKEFGKGGEN